MSEPERMKGQCILFLLQLSSRKSRHPITIFQYWLIYYIILACPTHVTVKYQVQFRFLYLCICLHLCLAPTDNIPQLINVMQRGCTYTTTCCVNPVRCSETIYSVRHILLLFFLSFKHCSVALACSSLIAD